MKTLITLLICLFSLPCFAQNKVLATVSYRFGSYAAIQVKDSEKWFVCLLDDTGVPDYSRTLHFKNGFDLFPCFYQWDYVGCGQVKRIKKSVNNS